MFETTGEIKAKRIDHAALADAQSLCRQFVVRHALDELDRFGGDILFCAHRETFFAFVSE